MTLKNFRIKARRASRKLLSKTISLKRARRDHAAAHVTATQIHEHLVSMDRIADGFLS